jgi:YbgC/YbaW family acyl-CoA thioester hydrolase
MNKEVYTWSTVVSIKETDLSANVYYLNYLSWCAKARELFAIDNYNHFQTAYSFLVKDIEHSFITNASFRDKIEIEIQIGKITMTSAKMIFTIFKINESGKILVGKQSQTLVTVDLQQGKPMRTPLEVQGVLQRFHITKSEI